MSTIWVFIFIAILGFIIYKAYNKDRERNVGRYSTQTTNQRQKTPQRKSFSVDIVGESHYQDNLWNITGGKTKQGHDKFVDAELVLENDNPYDNKAVRVDIMGLPVGHMKKPHARKFRQAVGSNENKSRYPIKGKIVGGWKDGKNEGHFGVKLEIPQVRL